MYKIIEHTVYLLYDGGDYYDESFETAKEAREEVRKLEGNDEGYVDQCILNLENKCTDCMWHCDED